MVGMLGTVTVNIKIVDANDLEGVMKRVMELKKSYHELNEKQKKRR